MRDWGRQTANERLGKTDSNERLGKTDSNERLGKTDRKTETHSGARVGWVKR